jgi:hypothetical protein
MTYRNDYESYRMTKHHIIREIRAEARYPRVSHSTVLIAVQALVFPLPSSAILLPVFPPSPSSCHVCLPCSVTVTAFQLELVNKEAKASTVHLGFAPLKCKRHGHDTSQVVHKPDVVEAHSFRTAPFTFYGPFGPSTSPNEKIHQIVLNPFPSGPEHYKYTPQRSWTALNPVETSPSSTIMDRIEEFATPIKRALEAHPVYAFVTLSLGFSVYRWNANRVGCMTGTSTSSVLKIATRSRYPPTDRKSLS